MPPALFLPPHAADHNGFFQCLADMAAKLPDDMRMALQQQANSVAHSVVDKYMKLCSKADVSSGDYESQLSSSSTSAHIFSRKSWAGRFP